MKRATVIYVIPNCDTMKKARKWLDDKGIDYEFHDYKKQGIDEERLRAWEAKLGWETLLNRRGMMWRRVPEEVRAGIDRESALGLMLETPSIIKRPVLDTGSTLHVGFKPEIYAEIFRSRAGPTSN